MEEKDKWINNFSGTRIGYHLCDGWSGWGLEYGQKVFFGKNILTKHFAHYVGVDLIGGYFKKSELQRVADIGIEKIFDGPDFIEKNHEESYKLNDDYFNYAESILKMDLSSRSDKELAGIIGEFMRAHEMAHAHSIVTTWFVDCNGQDLTNKLMALTDEYVKESGSAVKTSEAFSLLTTPTKVSLLNHEEIESFEILKLILSDKKSAEAIRNLSDFDSIPADVQTKIKERMLEHFNKWKWTPFGYLGPSHKVGDYLKFWQEQIKKDIEPDKEIKEKTAKFVETEENKSNLKKQLKISSNHCRVFDITADIVFLKGYRKDCTFHGYYVLDKILTEVGNRKFLSKNQLQVMTYFEIIDLLKSGKDPDMRLINERLKKSSVLGHKNGSIEILSGDKAEEFLKREDKYIEKDLIDKDATEFKGVCACSGYAKGVVKTVNTPEEMVKMKEGDIMLSHTTFPSLVPAMKKAAAIITEDGGVTCHAAIVSRELGTPCVTGIKSLTKVLKDGDMVEVDADKGIVRKL